MRAKQLLTIAVVSTLLIGGVAALGAASPAEQANANATGAQDNATGADAGGPESTTGAADDRAGNADGVGPSGGLPEQVPDHVSEIHDRIDSFLNGSIDNLGESLSELLGGDEPAENEGESADSGDGENENADSEAENADGDA